MKNNGEFYEIYSNIAPSYPPRDNTKRLSNCENILHEIKTD